MLTTDQKESILRKAGVLVPPFPARRWPVQERYLREGACMPKEELEADAEQRAAADAWARAIQTLYVEFTAARAARSLREAEQARSDQALQRASSDAWEHG